MKATKIDIILIAIIMFALIIFVGSAHGKNTVEVSPYVDFNGSIHGGFGDHYDGFGVGTGIGLEALYVVTDQFAIGLNTKTNINGEYYLKYYGKNTLVDEYGVWTGSAGGIMYVGNMFYMSYMAIIGLDVFHHDTYVRMESGDYELTPDTYNMDRIDYCVELGFRLQYHVSVYGSITTHVIENNIDKNKHQFYIGFKYHI